MRTSFGSLLMAIKPKKKNNKWKQIARPHTFILHSAKDEHQHICRWKICYHSSFHDSKFSGTEVSPTSRLVRLPCCCCLFQEIQNYYPDEASNGLMYIPQSPFTLIFLLLLQDESTLKWVRGQEPLSTLLFTWRWLCIRHSERSPEPLWKFA
jgi:hypothetical protein